MRVYADISANAHGMAYALHVPIEQEEQTTPLLMPLDDEGRPVIHITNSVDVDFYRWKIDYLRSDYHVASSRVISMVTPGFHTNMAYSPKSQSHRVMEVHSGEGYLVLGHQPQEGEDFATTMFKLDPIVTRQVTIPSGHFFTIEAPEGSEEPLVVSELFKINSGRELEDSEIVLEPGQQVIDTPDGPIEVPEEFSEGYFD